MGFHLAAVPIPAKVGPGFVSGLEYAATILRDAAERAGSGWRGEQRALDLKYYAALLADTAQQIVPVGEDVEGTVDAEAEGRIGSRVG